MTVLPFIFSLIFLCGCLFAMYSDFTRFEIPNTLCIVVAVGYLPFAISSGVPLVDLGTHYLVGLMALAIGFLLFLVRFLGGGDSKFIAAVILWFDTGDILPFLFYTTVFGGLLAILLIVFRLLPLPKRMLERPSIAKLHNKNSGIPYALAIGAAGLISYPQIMP